MKSFLQHLIEAPMTTSGAGNGSQRNSQRSGDSGRDSGVKFYNPKDAFHLGGGEFSPRLIKPGGPLDGGAYQPGAGPGDGSIPPTFSIKPVPGWKPSPYETKPYEPPSGYEDFWDFIRNPIQYTPPVKPPVKPPPSPAPERPSDLPDLPMPGGVGGTKGRGNRIRR